MQMAVVLLQKLKMYCSTFKTSCTVWGLLNVAQKRVILSAKRRTYVQTGLMPSIPEILQCKCEYLVYGQCFADAVTSTLHHKKHVELFSGRHHIR